MKLFQTILSFFLALAQLILAQDPSCPPRHSNEALISKTDMILKGHVRRTLEKITFIQCSLRCLKEDWCFSVNFEIQKRMGKCELNDYGVEDETSVSIEKGEFEKKEGFVYTQLRAAGISGCYQNRCQNGGTCKLDCAGLTPKCHCAYGFQGDRCEVDIDECSSNPCLHGGTCTDQVNGFSCTCAAGYSGIRCENNIDECSSNPCQNGGTCTDQVNGFSCTCAAGYSGIRCENNINECSSNPCQNGGTCADQVNGYSCTCAAGYSGTRCENNINECSSNPCQNGGTCADQVNGYSCTCAAGYSGTRCENRLVCELHFPSASTSNYIQALWSASSSIDEFTVSFWLKVPSTFTGEVVVLSYSTSSYIEALTVNVKDRDNDAQAEIEVMNSKEPVNSYFKRDGTWQHCCITWDRYNSSDDGLVIFYRDGTRTDCNKYLSPDRSLSTGGTLVIGQYQTSVGGGFAVNKLLVGHVTGLNIWSRAFTDNEVLALSKNCTSQQGDVVSWENIISSPLHGSVQKTCPSSCSP